MSLFGMWHPRILKVIHRREGGWDVSVGFVRVKCDIGFTNQFELNLPTC
jgi:hypothetical protein